MPNCDFYAVGLDHRVILDFVFSNPGWVLYESYSRPDQATRRFTSTDEILPNGVNLTESLQLQLYSPTMGGQPEQVRISLNPGAIPGASFRYRTAGWGLIQLLLESPRDKVLKASHTNHFSSKGAERWAPIRDNEPNKPGTWNWSEVRRISGRLVRFIKKCGVAKNGSRMVLPGAMAAIRRRECSMDFVFVTLDKEVDPIQPWELPPDDTV